MVGALQTSCPSNRLSRRLNQLGVSLSLLCSRIKDFSEMEFLIYSPKSKVAQEGILSSLDLEAPARNDGCPQGKVHPGRCPESPSRNQPPSEHPTPP